MSILEEQAEIRSALKAVEAEISAHTMPDADAIKFKIDHAIERLRTEKDLHELFELRGTINAALRDSVNLSFGGHQDYEFTVRYSINGGSEKFMVDDDKSMHSMGGFAVGMEKLQMANLKQDRLEDEMEKNGTLPKVISLDDINPQNLKAMMDGMPEPFEFEATDCKDLV